MLKLNASYAKKVPAEAEFSSKSYHASVELELSDNLTPDDLKARINQTFTLVRDAVEAELNGKSHPVPVRQETVASRPANGGHNGNGKASNKQVKYLLDLARQSGMDLPGLNAYAGSAYGVRTVYELSRTDASKLLDELKNSQAAA